MSEEAVSRQPESEWRLTCDEATGHFQPQTLADSLELDMDDIPLDTPAERLAPVGAAAEHDDDDDDDEDDDISIFKSHFGRQNSFDDLARERLQNLEEEQEQLNASLLALTTHFAQVQFKLTQVTQAPAQDKEDLLKQLEDFAFRGCPDLRAYQTGSSFKTPSISDGKLSSASMISESSSRGRQPSGGGGGFRFGDGIEEDHEKIIQMQREKQQELILQLKQQLEELESYAYECGADITPHTLLVEKQKIIIDELRSKVNLDLNDMNRMSTEELKGKVDNAICQITQPAKAREQLVNQLKTQIVDLERFIEYLQREGLETEALTKQLDFPSSQLLNHGCTCNCPMHGRGKRAVGDGQSDGESEQKRTAEAERRAASRRAGTSPSSTSPSKRKDKKTNPRRGDPETREDARKRTLLAARRTLQMLQMFTVAQLGCGTGTAADIRASKTAPSSRGENLTPMIMRLSKVVEQIIDAMSLGRPRQNSKSEEMAEPVSTASPDRGSELVINLVRREFFRSLVEILQHGLIDGPQTKAASSMPSNSKSTIPWSLWGCLSISGSGLYYSSSSRLPKDGVDSHPTPLSFHPWLLFVKYYELKGGKEYNESPARKLSDSYGLDIVAGHSITAKHILLSAIHQILSTHAPLKRSLDSQFKAFICLALNQKKLTSWIRLVMRTPQIVDKHFAAWSFMLKTEGAELYKNLDKLKPLDFNLPVDLAVRSFHNIMDAF